MAHNISQLKRRAAAMQATLSDLSDWTLGVACEPCARQVETPIRALAERHGANHPLGTLTIRLRCAVCRRGAAQILIRRGITTIRLEGVGAYR